MTYNFDAGIFAGRNRNRVYDIVVAAIEEAAQARGVTRKAMAERIGCSKAQISQLLSGPGNWTLDTVSNLLFAIDAEMDYQVVPYSDRANSNHFHPSAPPQNWIVGASQSSATVVGVTSAELSNAA